MKKILSVLVLLLLLIPFSVRADMGAPDVKSYDLQVTNPDGVNYYTDNTCSEVKGHLDKDATVTVVYESSEFFNIKIGDSETGFLKSIDGLSLLKDSLSPEEALGQGVEKLDTKQKAIVYADDGVDILSGPALAYKKSGHLKKGTEVEYEYYAGHEPVYIYVETKEGNGWLNILEKKVLLEYTEEYIIKNDIDTTCGTIPANTALKAKYKTDQWSHSALFTYNGCEVMLGIFRDPTTLLIRGGKYSSSTEQTIHKTADQSSEVVGTIPASTEFIGMASYFEYEGADTGLLYVEYNDVKGWITYDQQIVSYLGEAEIKSQVTDVVEPKKEEPKKEEKKETKKSSGLSGDTIVLISVIGGASVALAAIVTIVLVNKKKKNKKEEPVTETEEKKEE